MHVMGAWTDAGQIVELRSATSIERDVITEPSTTTPFMDALGLGASTAMATVMSIETILGGNGNDVQSGETDAGILNAQ